MEHLWALTLAPAGVELRFVLSSELIAHELPFDDQILCIVSLAVAVPKKCYAMRETVTSFPFPTWV